mmetsp:Transcript_23685/g.29364  ORF Transcript_23685/g.29364 Transcript_23685/m.29364 type:complete len:184 (-) Transcript_23685:81-632(-)
MKVFLKEAKQNFTSTDGLLYALIFVFIVTFICYPGLATTCTLNFMLDINNYISWKFDFLQALFNLLDSIGRFCGGFPGLMLSHCTIKLSSVVRIVFFALFLLVSFDVSFFESDWFIILNLVLFSFTNGYISTLCAVKAPQTVEGDAKGQVGGFVGITISTGIVLGSILAYAILPVLNASPEHS